MTDRYFQVTHERGAMMVIAKDKDDAVDQFYESISSVIGHTLKICGCFGDPKPIDRLEPNQI